MNLANMTSENSPRIRIVRGAEVLHSPFRPVATRTHRHRDTCTHMCAQKMCVIRHLLRKRKWPLMK
jgi:hypothetical protein